MLIKLIILMVVAGFVGLFFVKGPDGKPLMSVDDLLGDMKPATPVALKSPSGPTKVYKWQDENGVWQFGSQPADGAEAEVMELDGNINIIPAFKVPEESGSNRVSGRSEEPSAIGRIPAGLTSVSPEKIAVMMDTLDNLQETVDQRKADIDKATGVGN